MEKIDILMATYNGDKYIEEQIKSIINQSYKNWRLIISDDGSIDSTLRIIEKYVDNEKIILINNQRKGNPRDNFMNLLNYSDSRLIMFADQDDYWKQDKIYNAYNSIKDYYKEEMPIVSHSDLYVTDDKLNITNNSFFKTQDIKESNKIEFFITQNCIVGCTTIFNDVMKEYMLKIKNPKNLMMHDWAMGVIGSIFGKVIFNKNIDILYRQHGKNSVGAKNIHSAKYIYEKLCNLKDVKENIQKTQIQANEIFTSFLDDITNNDDFKIIKIYGMFPSFNKITKMYYLTKLKINRNSFVRNVILYLFC